MKSFEDNKLKSLIKDVRLDSPGPNFTNRVMNQIFKENPVLEKIKGEKIFGKGFWIIIGLFAALMAVMYYFTIQG